MLGDGKRLHTALTAHQPFLVRADPLRYADPANRRLVRALVERDDLVEPIAPAMLHVDE